MSFFLSGGFAVSDNRLRSKLHDLTGDIVASHISKNAIPVGDLTSLIGKVYRALAIVGAAPEAAVAEQPEPAVPVKHSITPDYIVCLEDGRKLKMLKRHLMSAYNLTPEAYRARWNLPANYPMVAPNYARHRSKLAKTTGLNPRAAADND
jgi:predicted transcriptional regulator